MINKIIEITFSGIWNFLGVFLILYILTYYGANLILKYFSRFTRMAMVLFRGWPPSHLDADGDWGTK
jgi:hypothetical protein